MRYRTGTSGFAYKEWKGPFYPEKLPQSGMLSYYASRLDTVEINYTFYRMPSEKMVRNWVEQTPADFSLVLKASRRITHHKKLKDAAEPLRFLLTASEALGERRGPMLFQLPPTLQKDVDVLRAFLTELPQELKAAFEFRHRSWFDEEVYAALRERNAALVVADGGKEEAAAVVPTADFGYARLRREDYDDVALAEWGRRLRQPGWQGCWVFFKHEDAGAGPRLAERFRELATAANP
jgi:uncharacterized protein YecE (DUF72 family)